MQLNLRNLTTIATLAASGVACAQSSGTAFVVAPGLLVTNHHVIDDCGAIEVVASDGRRPATVVDSVQIIDLALLRVYGLRGGVASLRTQSPVLLGESATVFGFPLGGALSSTGNFTTGVVSSLRGLGDAAGEIQITAPVQPGNSGGPVLDRAGVVIGVVQSKLDALWAVKATGDVPQNVNFAVSLDVLADFLAKNNVPIKSAARQVAIENTQVAEMAQSFTYKISCKAATTLHANQAWLAIGKVLEKLDAHELQTHHLTRFLVYPMQLKHTLGDIDTDDCFANIHVGPSGLPVEITATIHPWAL